MFMKVQKYYTIRNRQILIFSGDRPRFRSVAAVFPRTLCRRRSGTAFLWALARLQVDDAEVVHAALVEAHAPLGTLGISWDWEKGAIKNYGMKHETLLFLFLMGFYGSFSEI